MHESRQQRAEAFGHFLRPRCGDPGRGTAVERPAESDDLNPLGLASFIEILARHLHGQLASLSARIAEKRRVGKGFGHQPIRQRFLLRDMVEVRRMPQRLRLIRQRLHQRWIRMAERVHRDPRAKVEKTSPIRLDQPCAFAFDKGQRGAIVGWQNGRDHLFVLERGPRHAGKRAWGWRRVNGIWLFLKGCSMSAARSGHHAAP